MSIVIITYSADSMLRGRVAQLHFRVKHTVNLHISGILFSVNIIENI